MDLEIQTATQFFMYFVPQPYYFTLHVLVQPQTLEPSMAWQALQSHYHDSAQHDATTDEILKTLRMHDATPLHLDVLLCLGSQVQMLDFAFCNA